MTSRLEVEQRVRDRLWDHTDEDVCHAIAAAAYLTALEAQERCEPATEVTRVLVEFGRYKRELFGGG
ncbi:hypothetical protein [Cellulomonas sp. HZM]|uniref:hypothetical protein n=1 Tax=Cellulomonas sp. HZM TaxID=1454010 RepID=UPI000AC9EE85|nr:hypothetical protein [Cellulomonas sp. HZM]